MAPARQRILSRNSSENTQGRKPPAKLRVGGKGSKDDTGKSKSKSFWNSSKKKDAPPVSSTKFLIFGHDSAIKLLFTTRLFAAIWSHISDCDETFNYWDPLHYMIYGKGLQTWEYSPEYALRSYTYLMMCGLPAWFYNSIYIPNPMLMFYFVRCILGIVCAIVEFHFYKAVCREFGIHVGHVWLIFQFFCAGMFISSTAFLPSSFSMYLGSAALAEWWFQRYNSAVFLTAISALLGWPFAGAIGLPIALDMIFRQKMLKNFIVWTGISAATILIPMTLIDSTFFGRVVVAPINLIIYNVFSSHGPNLYGIESFKYYLVNGFLNFNIVWFLALGTPFLLTICHYFVPAKSKSTLYLPHWLSLAPFYLWLLIFWPQPHKEERFLFPVYLLINLCGAISLDVIQKVYFRIKGLLRGFRPGSHYWDESTVIAGIFIAIATLLGVSRIFTLYRNYHAPINLMIEFNNLAKDKTLQVEGPVNVCFGKDWYRFPSSFFLPTNYRVRFIESEFKGMLPAYFDETANGTQIIHPYFNDRNEGNDFMLFNYTKCHFLIDLDVGRYSDLEPNFLERDKEWSLLKQLPFVNAEESHNIFRAFYIPYFSDKYVEFGSLNLLKRRKLKFE
ncbi:alpha-1,2-mannosyltransferase ALG9 [Phlebotomus papatasi]|uniref:alpha-1,2-mannosyltransferase ALG9 n=1 Tax=Phlebotomus papatasi TaxID=29031 RepID=UPI0024837577|nr:alpha-1,2-mannosyltransferase ALG9 [Phlebotomus papatasi]